MTADELRRAAELLRVQVRTADLGAWRVSASDVTGLHPAIANALADWLAEGASGYLIERGYMSDRALDIARLINGGAS